jgi:hypothetical protein
LTLLRDDGLFLQADENAKPSYAFGSSAILGSFVASGATCGGVAEEARTRGFAAPAFAGCAFVEVWGYGSRRYADRQAKLSRCR